MQKSQVTILINQRPYHFDSSTLEPADFRNAVGAAGDYEVWRIVRDPDPELQLPVDDTQITGPTTVQSGERFRVVPPGTFGFSGVPPQLQTEVEELRSGGLAVDLVLADGWQNVVIRGHALPPHFNQETTDLLLRLPVSYPSGKPDMFWTEPTVTLKDGRVPNRADSIEVALGRSWRRFSWHPSSWNPASDNLRTYLEFVGKRLATKE